ncbi:hypothetical protein [Micromonospora mirobrigensis]|uniref:Uncharacterized protein n=1 Tax=Micromonospora mirobrigensis TaxID=262898 RepID=A0A1C4XHY6_9ACTN|nr:hypothetical protein [Micromonospora mirobrigensis]SCF08115.1 hypothetical protein GA0070564_103110 [Micromonospora mirobrigensis]
MIDIDDLRRGLSEIAAEADAVDLRERALATSHRIRVRRTAASVVAGLTVAAVALGTVIGVRADRPPVPSATTPAPTAPAPTTLPTEQQSGQPDIGPLASATVTVPSWGATADATCTTGTVTLTGGQSPGDGVHRAVNVLSYVATDVDLDGAEDYVAHLMCGEGPESGGSQIVAFRRTGRTFVPIGRVVGTRDGLAMMDHLEARGDGRVAVLVSKEYTDGGQNSVPNQWRTYAWRDGRFRQVAGPTTFPARPPAARLSVVASALPFRPVGNGFTGRLTVTVSNEGDVDVARLQILLVLPAQLRPAGAGWQGCAVRPSSDQTALVCTLPGPRARSRISVPFTFAADDRPVSLDDPVGLGNHYVSISQLPPFDGQVTIDEPEAVIPISVP